MTADTRDTTELSRADIQLIGKALYRAAGEAEMDLAERVILSQAKYREGDEVRWYESPRQPEFRGEVYAAKVLGFPEVTDGFAIGYEVDFPGPEGVGRETHDVQERDLVPYDEEEAA